MHDSLSPRARDTHLVLLDQRDSFTWNLAHACAFAGAVPHVVSASTLDLASLRASAVTHVILGPGPGHPSAAAAVLELLRAPPAGVAILGVCLGHQQIGLAAGARIERARELVHGWTSRVEHDGRGVFRGLPTPFAAARYHSLALARDARSAALEISATTGDGEIMGVRSRAHALEGVQFHPESVLAEHGVALLRNFLTAPWRGADHARSSTSATAPRSDA